MQGGGVLTAVRQTAGYIAPGLDPLLTVDEVAAHMQVDPRTVRRMIADGRLPVKRIGRSVRVALKTLKAFLDSS
jgi:excisionase family DNA binding protein